MERIMLKVKETVKRWIPSKDIVFNEDSAIMCSGNHNIFIETGVNKGLQSLEISVLPRYSKDKRNSTSREIFFFPDKSSLLKAVSADKQLYAVVAGMIYF